MKIVDNIEEGKEESLLIDSTLIKNKGMAGMLGVSNFSYLKSFLNTSDEKAEKIPDEGAENKVSLKLTSQYAQFNFKILIILL